MCTSMALSRSQFLRAMAPRFYRLPTCWLTSRTPVRSGLYSDKITSFFAVAARTSDLFTRKVRECQRGRLDHFQLFKVHMSAGA